MKTTILLAMVLLLGVPIASHAQSNWTTGTTADRGKAAFGYWRGGSHRGSLYDYAPGYYGHRYWRYRR
jgi:hypothetical protein